MVSARSRRERVGHAGVLVNVHKLISRVMAARAREITCIRAIEQSERLGDHRMFRNSVNGDMGIYRHVVYSCALCTKSEWQYLYKIYPKSEKALKRLDYWRLSQTPPGCVNSARNSKSQAWRRSSDLIQHQPLEVDWHEQAAPEIELSILGRRKDGEHLDTVRVGSIRWSICITESAYM